MDQDFERRLKQIEDRNKRVEEDKAWEKSATRRALIALLTFIFIGLYMSWLGVTQPWLNAIVPVVGFLLSTLAVGVVKNFWVRRRRHDS